VINVAEVFVAGLTQANARRLIDRAHEVGLPASVVRTVDGGFIVPTVVAEESAPTPTTPTPEPEPAPAKRSTRRATKSQSADETTADAVASEET
jgi:hypothetical protein